MFHVALGGDSDDDAPQGKGAKGRSAADWASRALLAMDGDSNFEKKCRNMENLETTPGLIYDVFCIDVVCCLCHVNHAGAVLK